MEGSGEKEPAPLQDNPAFEFDETSSCDDKSHNEEDGRPNNENGMVINTDKTIVSITKTDKGAATDPSAALLYTIYDNPPWHTCLVLGLQHYLMMVESTVSIPYLLTPKMCMDKSDPARGAIASTIIFASGIITLLQTTFGIRLPIVQGGTHTMLGPAIAIISLLPCPSDDILNAMSADERQETWQIRMRQIQGAICAAALFQVLLGLTGMVGRMLKLITPLVIVPTVLLIGLSLFPIAGDKAAKFWPISILTMGLLILFSQYLGDVQVPLPSYSLLHKKMVVVRVKIFKLFPVILALSISWIVCLILTETGSLDPHNEARTDLQPDLISKSPWFRVPYPCQWGLPVVTLAGFMGMLAGIISSVIESIGDYYACARLSGAPAPPAHAMNRGIFMEGVGTILAGLLGTASGTTSYSQNVGAIGVTKVGSRRVVQYSGLIMVVCGLSGKVGALFITIPEPIIGGLFFIVFGMIAAVGLSSLQFIDLNSARNMFVLGFSIFFGVTVPAWMNLQENKNAINTSVPELDQVLTVLLKTSMFVGGFLGMVLDNTVPGTREERGLVKWEAMLHGGARTNIPATNLLNDTCYDLPIGMSFLRKFKCMERVPISPSYNPTHSTTSHGLFRRLRKIAKF